MKSKEAIFLGYGIDTKGYRLFDCVKRKVYFSRDVQFDEGKFFKCRDDIELDNTDMEFDLETHLVENYDEYYDDYAQTTPGNFV